MATDYRHSNRWLVFVLASLVLGGYTWFYATVIRLSPSHRTYGAFVLSGQAANQHEDPFAVRPGIWPIHRLGGIAGCAAVLFSPLGWYTYLLAAFPALAVRRFDWFALGGAALMFIWDRSWFSSGHGIRGLSGTVPYLVATMLFIASFWRNHHGLLMLQESRVPPVTVEGAVG